MSRSFTRDFLLEVAKGNIPGHSSINKFGENPDVDAGPEDVWGYGGTYTYSTTADIDSLSSSDNGDTQDITVVGLDTTWAEVTQTITLTGQTTKALDTDLIRVYRMYNPDNTDFAGTVYCYVSGGTVTAGVPQVVADVRAIIVNGDNQTLMAQYTVPAGKTAYFIAGYVAFSKGRTANADFSWKARPFGGVFQVKSKIGLVSTGSSTWSYTYGVPAALPEKTDIKVVCEEVSAADCAVSAGFDLVLVDD